MPSSIQAVIVVMLFLMPGFIARRILSWAYPSSEPSDAHLALTAVTLSCVNYGIWSWLLVLSWQKDWYKSDGFLALLAVLVLFLSPVVGTLVIVKFMRTSVFRRLREIFGIRHPTPKAWDYFFGRRTACWIIVTLKSGDMIGGYFGAQSFSSSFPHEEDLYLELLCDLTPEGKISRITPLSLGGIIHMEDVELLEFFRFEPRDIEEALEASDAGE
jgi:hypothetical protein